jgi:hypothetical protein
MKRAWLFVMCLFLAAPGYLQSEALRLKDGSVIKGRLVRVESDTLYFETSFGSTVALHRGTVARIDFEEGLAPSAGEPPAEYSLQTTAEAGTLSVSFEKFKLTSRIVVKHGGDQKAYARENSIGQSLVVGDRTVYSVVDSITDKTVRKGPDTVLRNDVEPVDFRVALAPGIYRCAVVFENVLASAYVDVFDPSPLDKRLVLDPVRIDAGSTSHVRVGLKRKWTGKTELVKLD